MKLTPAWIKGKAIPNTSYWLSVDDGPLCAQAKSVSWCIESDSGRWATGETRMTDRFSDRTVIRSYSVGDFGLLFGAICPVANQEQGICIVARREINQGREVFGSVAYRGRKRFYAGHPLE